MVAAFGAAGAGSAAAAVPPGGSGPAGQSADDGLTFVNGRIHTMDDAGTVARAVSMRNGQFVAVGNAAPNPGPGNRVIDLGGRTVVPGLIESHTHFVSLANRPGYHVAELELAESLDEALEMLAARRAQGDVPEGEFITAMGGWHPRQWFSPPDALRLPTRAELDDAVPDRPVMLYQGGGGPGVTNTLGKEFFEHPDISPPVLVGDNGELANVMGVNHANRALYQLRIRQSFADNMRSAIDSMAFSARVGVTAMLDQTLVAGATGTLDPDSLNPQPTHALNRLNHFRMYDGWIAVHRAGEALVRLQMNFLHNQGNIPELGDLDNQLPELRERLKNQFQFFGDDMLRTGAIGEWAAPFAAPGTVNHPVWFEAQRLVAQARWRNENSQAGTVNIGHVIDAYEAVDAEFGITDLRWGLQHGDLATEEQLQRLKDLNVGVSTSGFRWQNTATTPPANPVGPLFPRLVESGIILGLHEDGVHIAPHNPWYALHYATTGLNVFGVQINPGQQISRQKALELYTRGNAWYLNREDVLGSIEPGKFADLLVLDKDYFTVSDEEMRRISPVMTVVGGRIVHDTGVVG